MKNIEELVQKKLVFSENDNPAYEYNFRLLQQLDTAKDETYFLCEVVQVDKYTGNETKFGKAVFDYRDMASVKKDLFKLYYPFSYNKVSKKIKIKQNLQPTGPTPSKPLEYSVLVVDNVVHCGTGPAIEDMVNPKNNKYYILGHEYSIDEFADIIKDTKYFPKFFAKYMNKKENEA